MLRCVIVVIDGYNIQQRTHGKNMSKINSYSWLELWDFSGRKSVINWKVIFFLNQIVLLNKLNNTI